MEKFELHILGCGSALPTLKHAPSSQIINLRDKLFMIDCGEGTQVQMRHTGLHFSRLNHIFISHLHGDHCFGLIGLISTFGMMGRTAQLHLYSPGTMLEQILKPQLEFFCKDIAYEVVFHSFSPNHSETIYDDRSVTVKTLPLKHNVPCCGFFFEEKPQLPHIRKDMIDFLKIPVFEINRIKAGGDWTDTEGKIWKHEKLTIPTPPGRKYAYVSDTMPNEKLIDIISGCDLLYHEATFAENEKARAKETNHSTARQAAEFAVKAQVKKLAIGHFSARYDDDKILQKEAKDVFTNVILCHEKMKIVL